MVDLLQIEPYEPNWNEIRITIQQLSFKEMHLSAK